jgi:hypothetical protein
MLRSGILIVTCLAVGLSASAQQSGRATLDPAYHGIWAVNDTCDRGMTFIFAATWIERASEDICYIDKVEPFGQGVRVTATCWHEFMQVGRPTYDMTRRPDGRMTFANLSEDPVKLCGPVPQNLIDAYKDGK